MLHEVDKALLSLLRREVLGEAPIALSLDPPNRPWIAAVDGPTVNVFLYDVRENAGRRDVMLEPVYDDSGSLVGRRAPARRYDLYYTISAWAPSVALEHHLLAAVAAGLAGHEVMPSEHLPPALSEVGTILLGAAGGMKRGMPGNLGGDLKLQLEVVVTVPMPVKVDLTAAALAEQGLSLSVQGNRRPPVPAQRPPVRPPAPGGPRPPVADPAAARRQLADATAAGSAGSPGSPGSAVPPSGPTAPAQGRPAAGPPRPPAPPAPSGRPSVDPLAQVRAALLQAAQAQAALAAAQAALASALAGSRPAAARAPSAQAAPALSGRAQSAQAAPAPSAAEHRPPAPTSVPPTASS